MRRRRHSAVMRCCVCSEGAACEWFSEIDLPTLSAMLTTLFYQCVECLADPMWELRRMAGQVIALVFSFSDTALLLDIVTVSLRLLILAHGTLHPSTV